MKLIVDSGASKTDWAIIDKNKIIHYSRTRGSSCLNFDTKVIEAFLKNINKKSPIQKRFQEVYFYGAGCISDRSKAIIRRAFGKYLKCNKIHINSDVVGVARALFQQKSGIIGILGTGSASSVWNGTMLVEQIPSLGYLLGDEGSGFAIVRDVLRHLFRGTLLPTVQKELLKNIKLTETQLLEKIYISPNPKAYIASLFPQIAKLITYEQIFEIVFSQINQFTKIFLLPLRNKYPSYEIGLCGSVVYFLFSNAFYADYFKNALNLQNQKILILRNPIRKLAKYHCNSHNIK